LMHCTSLIPVSMTSQFFFVVVLLLCWVKVHWSIYNVSNISYLNSPTPLNFCIRVKIRFLFHSSTSEYKVCPITFATDACFLRHVLLASLLKINWL
jgi:hypothetical protein